MDLVTKSINLVANFSSKLHETLPHTIVKFPFDVFESAKDKNFYINLTKSMAYALRHKPKECGLILDTQGYTDIDLLLNYLRTLRKFKVVTKRDLINAVNSIEKKRFEIKDDKIRAYYGHSFKDKILKIATIPPKILYHGTSNIAMEKIITEGLTHQSRQYVHLSVDIDTATTVAKRRDLHPVILCVDALRAFRDGIKFYIGNQNVWLADNIPIKYIKKI